MEIKKTNSEIAFVLQFKYFEIGLGFSNTWRDLLGAHLIDFGIVKSKNELVIQIALLGFGIGIGIKQRKRIDNL